MNVKYVTFKECPLKDGGLLYVETNNIEKWGLLYPELNIKEEIKKIDFSKCSRKAALRKINETLKEKGSNG